MHSLSSLEHSPSFSQIRFRLSQGPLSHFSVGPAFCLVQPPMHSHSNDPSVFMHFPQLPQSAFSGEFSGSSHSLTSVSQFSPVYSFLHEQEEMHSLSSLEHTPSCSQIRFRFSQGPISHFSVGPAFCLVQPPMHSHLNDPAVFMHFPQLPQSAFSGEFSGSSHSLTSVSQFSPVYPFLHEQEEMHSLSSLEHTPSFSQIRFRLSQGPLSHFSVGPAFCLVQPP